MSNIVCNACSGRGVVGRYGLYICGRCAGTGSIEKNKRPVEKHRS